MAPDRHVRSNCNRHCSLDPRVVYAQIEVGDVGTGNAVAASGEDALPAAVGGAATIGATTAFRRAADEVAAESVVQ